MPGRGRVIGGIVGWLIGVLPIAGVDAAEYLGFYLPNPVLFGALALAIGVILGGIISGYLGGRSKGDGAVGASISGAISSALYVLSTITLLLLSASLGVMTPISSDQIFHVAAALLFFAALWLGIAMLTGFLTGRDSSSPQESHPPYRQSIPPRYTESGNAGRSSRPVITRQLGTNDYNRHDRSRSGGSYGDQWDRENSGNDGSHGNYRDSRSSSRPRYPDQERDPRLS
jgi:hypothetical protein